MREALIATLLLLAAILVTQGWNETVAESDEARKASTSASSTSR